MPTVSFNEMLLSASLAGYVVASLMVSFVRWGHRCEPYAQHQDYYFPAWKAVIWCFLSNLLLFPAIFMPQHEDAIMQLRILLMLNSPFFCAMLMFTYFGRIVNVKWWKSPLYTLAILYGASAIPVTVLTILPEDQMTGNTAVWIVCITGILAVVYLLVYLVAILFLAKHIRRFAEENFSNPDDFPKQYATGVILVSLTHVSISWFASFMGDPPVMAACLLVLTVLIAVFLIGALTPHREMDIRRLQEKEKTPAVRTTPKPLTESAPIVLSEEKKDEIAALIRRAVEVDKIYLDSHLTLASLAKACGINRTYVSIVISDRLGGFFQYVIRCRLAHAANYKVQHPGASVEEVVEASGFGSRQSYYNVRRQMEV